MTNIEALMQAKQERIDALHVCRPGRTALLVIDMQRGFLDPGAALEVPPGRDIIPNIQQLIETCRHVGVPVIFTEFVYGTSVPCLRGEPFGPEHLPAEADRPTGLGYPSNNCLISPDYEMGPDSAETVADLAPRKEELVVRAHTYDKFYGTPLDLALRSQDIRYLMMTGVLTEVCVNATLMTAAMREYRVTAVTDAMATLWPELQEACFTIWQRKFARLRDTEEMVDEIGGFAE